MQKTGRRVLITGGARGFGKALTRVFYKQGWSVIPLVRNQEDAGILQEEFGESIFPIVGNVQHDSVCMTIESTLNGFEGGLDLLINNAGVVGYGWSLEKLSLEEMGNLFEVHCVGALRCARSCLPFLLQSRAPHIINVSSRLGSLRKSAGGEFETERHSYAYRIAKAALNMATLCMAQDEGLRGIRVTAIHPGRMQTPLGGEDAPNTPEQSARRLFERLIDNSLEHGAFLDLHGGHLDW